MGTDRTGLSMERRVALVIVGVVTALLASLVARFDFESVNFIGHEEVINYVTETAVIFGDERAETAGDYVIRDQNGSDLSGKGPATVWLVDSNGELIEPVFQGKLRHAKRYVRDEGILFIGSIEEAEAWTAAQRAANVASWWRKPETAVTVAAGVGGLILVVVGVWPRRRGARPERVGFGPSRAEGSPL